jgi:hypothetical protein
MQLCIPYVFILLLNLWSNFCHAKSTSGKIAVIISGKEFYHEGKKLRQTLIEKDYTVHLTEVYKDKKRQRTCFNVADWTQTPLMKSLNEEHHYKHLLFIIAAHGHPDIGANITWSSLL